MTLRIIDIPDAPERDGKEFDEAVRERLVSPHAVKLPVFTFQQLQDLTPSHYTDYIVKCSNGDAGSECLAYCDGFNWKVVQLGSNIALS